MTARVSTSTVNYPGGLTVEYRWAGSGAADAVFHGLGSTTGEAAAPTPPDRVESAFPVAPVDHGKLMSADPDRLCRAQLVAAGPMGRWVVRLASAIFDEPTAVTWDSVGLLVVKYGFAAYALDARTGELRWLHRARTPLVAVLGSPRFDHVLVQGEVETFALEADGKVRWRATHSDVIAGAQLVAGRLVLTSFSGAVATLDATTGRPT